ncbi:MAG: phosphate acyltransferase PlsX [Candidatus Hydrogenedentes bacterium]|nr:phosphate acyltransferase PlsX [Candidatus Hydrogenedentota bacterium]
MRIALDAMGSDNAPGPEVRGAVEASLRSGVEVILVGDQAVLEPALAAIPKRGKVSIVHASEVIRMTDSPVMAVRQKKDSSLLVALRLVKEGKADGVVSAGNTGAVMVAARTILGPIQGVARSAICQTLPTTKDPVLILDLGANVDCSARHLCEFAEMGVIYSRYALGVQNPRVGLLNIGEEQLKGNELAKTVHRTLSAAKQINFVGNIEPKALFKGEVDVLVCDGFVGNLVLKTSEAVAGLVTTLVRRELRSSLLSKIGGLLSLGAYRRLKKTVDPNEYTGAPLLGVNGIVIILHGASNARGVANAIRGACIEVECELNEHIREAVHAMRRTEVV